MNTTGARALDLRQLFCKICTLLWRSSKSTFLMLILFNLISGLAIPVVAMIWKYFLDSVVLALQNGDLVKPVFWVVVHFLYGQFNNIISNICRYLESNQADYLNKYISGLTLDKVATLEMKDFDDSTLFDEIQKVNNDSAQHSMNLLRTFITLLQNIASISGAIVIFLSFGPFILLVSFVACLPSLFVNLRMSSKLFLIFTKRFEQLRFIGYLKSILTTYENIKEIKVNRLHAFIKDIVIQRFDEFLQEDKKIRKKFMLQNCMTNFLENAVAYGFQIYILFKVVSRNLTVGDVTLFISTINNFNTSVEAMLRSVSSLYDDGLYIQNLFSLLERDSLKSQEERLPFPEPFDCLEFRHVYFKYPGSDEFVLKDISFTLHANKNYSFVGLNGSGKTTLMKLILKLYDPTHGDILLGGINLREIDSTDYYRQVGVIFQDFIRYPFDIEKNIALGDIDSFDNFPRVVEAAVQSGAAEFIEQLPLKYATMVNKEWSNATQLSLGQWQKIAISRAFMSPSSILILDEPTASLDANAEYELFRKFKDLMEGKTTILISHRFSTIRLVDEILVLQEGTVLEKGNHEALMTHDGEYARLYRMQTEMYQEGLLAE